MSDTEEVPASAVVAPATPVPASSTPELPSLPKAPETPSTHSAAAEPVTPAAAAPGGDAASSPAPAAASAAPAAAAVPATPMSPAERAAQRRAKILARGDSRMALVTGSMNANTFQVKNSAPIPAEVVAAHALPTPAAIAPPTPAPAAKPATSNAADTASVEDDADADSSSSSAASGAADADSSLRQRKPDAAPAAAKPAAATAAAKPAAAAPAAAAAAAPSVVTPAPLPSALTKPIPALRTYAKAETVLRLLGIFVLACLFSSDPGAPAVAVPAAGAGLAAVQGYLAAAGGALSSAAMAIPFASARPVAALVILYLCYEAAVAWVLRALRARSKAEVAAAMAAANAALPRGPLMGSRADPAAATLGLMTPMGGAGGAGGDAAALMNLLDKAAGQADVFTAGLGNSFAGKAIAWSGTVMSTYKTGKALVDGFCFLVAVTTVLSAARALV